MLEEIIGSSWHRFITRRADKSYPDAIVYLDDMRRIVGIYFRALGGEGGLQVVNATELENKSRRSILERVAGIGNKIQYAWRDEETLRLPDSIALYPTRELNFDLYLWLTAISTIEIEDTCSTERLDWIAQNQYRTRKTLEIWPGLTDRYRQLLQAHLLLRPSIAGLPADEARQETVIVTALSDPLQVVELQYAKQPPRPVCLWLHPSPPQSEYQRLNALGDNGLVNVQRTNKDQKKNKTRKRGNRTDMPEGNTGLMSFRLESLWSWAEYSKVDRTSTDEDDDDATQTAQDMDNITVAQDKQSIPSSIKLDMDLPSTEYDDIVLGAGIPVDEWDYKQQRLLKNHCRLQTMLPRHAEAMELPKSLRVQARQIRRKFEIIQPQRRWENRQSEGTEIDLESYITFLADRKQGRVNSDTPVYRALRNNSRDLSCLLLADLSLSTDVYINDEARVIDVIRDALFLFSEALSATGDRFSIHGFSSRNRDHVRFYNIKNFSDRYDDVIRGRINAIKPGYYTRMGAAIRYASGLLSQQSGSQKLLLIITDGRPNDLDKYEGRYGIEDTRMAVLEAEKMGLRPFCVTVDEQAEDYLPYVFGSRSFMLIRNAEELPKKLPQLYLKLTQ